LKSIDIPSSVFVLRSSNGDCSRKCRGPRYSFGGTVRICRHCFESLPSLATAITTLGNHPRGAVGLTAASAV
jgi:hypothetical protein